jgi:hypothetical protein
VICRKCSEYWQTGGNATSQGSGSVMLQAIARCRVPQTRMQTLAVMEGLTRIKVIVYAGEKDSEVNVGSKRAEAGSLTTPNDVDHSRFSEAQLWWTRLSVDVGEVAKSP